MNPSNKHERPPSVPDLDAIPDTYDEPDTPPADDRLPAGDVTIVPASSRAVLRMRIEELLQRREPPSIDVWRALGPEAQDILVTLLDDATVAGHDALRQRVIATTAQLGAVEALPRLGQLLLDRSERALTRTFAANALGRIDPDAAIAVLGRAVGDEDATVRRQVARALGAARDPAAVSYLQQLAADPTPHVADVAAAQLRALGHEAQAGPEIRDRPRNAQPAPEVAD